MKNTSVQKQEIKRDRVKSLKGLNSECMKRKNSIVKLLRSCPHHTKAPQTSSHTGANSAARFSKPNTRSPSTWRCLPTLAPSRLCVPYVARDFAYPARSADIKSFILLKSLTNATSATRPLIGHPPWRLTYALTVKWKNSYATFVARVFIKKAICVITFWSIQGRSRITAIFARKRSISCPIWNSTCMSIQTMLHTAAVSARLVSPVDAISNSIFPNAIPRIEEGKKHLKRFALGDS